MNMIKNKIKAILLKTKTKTINTIRQIEIKTGYKWENIVDSMFVGGLMLVIVKLIYRIYVGINPFWYINLGIYLLGIILQLKYDILKHIREDFVNLWKPLLGKNYYPPKEYTELYFDIANNLVDIEKGTLINKFWQYVYIKLVQLRLFILAHLILYLIIYITLIYLLLFNKYLITASLVSIILLMSRLALHASDYTINDLTYIINMIEKVEEDETVAPTYLNAEIMTLVATRSFGNRKWQNELMEEKQALDKLSYKLITERQLKITVYPRYIQLYPKYINYTYRKIGGDKTENRHILYTWRRAYYEDAISEEICPFTDHDDIINVWKNKTNKRYKEILKKRKKMITFKHILSMPIPLITKIKGWFQNTADTTKEITLEKIPWKNPNGPGHPLGTTLNDSTNSIIVLNTSTIRENRPYIQSTHKMPMNEIKSEKSRYGALKLARSKALTEQKMTQERDNMQKLFESNKLSELSLPKDHFIIAQLAYPPKKTIEAYKDYMNERSNLVQPSQILIKNVMFDPRASKQQAIHAHNCAIDYYEAVLRNGKRFHMTKDVKDDYLNAIEQSKYMLLELQENPMFIFSSISDPDIEKEIAIVERITKDITDNPTIPYPISMKLSLAEAFNITPSEAGQRYVSNIYKIDKNQGRETENFPLNELRTSKIDSQKDIKQTLFDDVDP